YTLLIYRGLTTDLLPYTVDKSHLKVGLYTPGTHIPVLPASTLIERQPDYSLILAWNFAEEIMRQQREYRERGGRFIIPIPIPKGGGLVSREWGVGHKFLVHLLPIPHSPLFEGLKHESNHSGRRARHASR